MRVYLNNHKGSECFAKREGEADFHYYVTSKQIQVESATTIRAATHIDREVDSIYILKYSVKIMGVTALSDRLGRAQR